GKDAIAAIGGSKQAVPGGPRGLAVNALGDEARVAGAPPAVEVLHQLRWPLRIGAPGGARFFRRPCRFVEHVPEERQIVGRGGADGDGRRHLQTVPCAGSLRLSRYASTASSMQWLLPPYAVWPSPS